MKIFIVCNNLGNGGAERVGVNLANGFADHGHQVFIITDIHQKANYPVDGRIKILPFYKNDDEKSNKWRKTTLNIRKYAKIEKPDVIIGIMTACTFISYVATLGMDIPIIMTEHNPFERPSYAPLNFKQKLFKFWINKLYKKVTVLTEADKLYIGTRLKNVAVMPNPLFLAPIKEIPHKEKTVLAAGRVDDWHYKGFDILLQAWSRIMKNEENEIKENANWWLKIAGAGKQESFEYLMSILKDSDFKCHVSSDGQMIWSSEKYHIEFLGFQKDMESLYKKSEIFVLSSRYEGFGLVLIEAMSQGCAPIACDYKGRQREIIQDDSQGLCCKPDHVEELADAIQKMMIDKDYRKTVQQNAIERSKFYELDHIISMWEDLIKKIS